jgi:hypothetical protein
LSEWIWFHPLTGSDANVAKYCIVTT